MASTDPLPAGERPDTRTYLAGLSGGVPLVSAPGTSAFVASRGPACGPNLPTLTVRWSCMARRDLSHDPSRLPRSAVGTLWLAVAFVVKPSNRSESE